MKAVIIAILGSIAVGLMIAGSVINWQNINRLEYNLAVTKINLQCYIRDFENCKEQLGVFYMPPKGGEVSDNRTNKATIRTDQKSIKANSKARVQSRN